LAKFPNCRFHLTPYADLSCLDGTGLTAVYATAVFIHFNPYDIFFYLQECARLLPVGGKVFFDYCDGERFSIHDSAFLGHGGGYRGDRSKIFNVLNYVSPGIVANISRQLGFETLDAWADTAVDTSVILQKRRHVS
jgi:hypothetical protein